MLYIIFGYFLITIKCTTFNLLSSWYHYKKCQGLRHWDYKRCQKTKHENRFLEPYFLTKFKPLLLKGLGVFDSYKIWKKYIHIYLGTFKKISLPITKKKKKVYWISIWLCKGFFFFYIFFLLFCFHVLSSYYC